MATAADRSAEESYALCAAHARVLDVAARRMAAAGDAPGALAAAWGGDVYAAQAVLWERIMGAAAATRRRLYLASDALFRGLRVDPGHPDEASVQDVIAHARGRLVAECDASLAERIAGTWPDAGYLAQLPAPTWADLEASAAARLGGLTSGEFVTSRRAACAEAMDNALAQRVRGEIRAAVASAYDADFLGLEAYLVESAIAAGDTVLQTVVVRWELASAAVSAVPALPEGFVPAVEVLREAICSGLADADAARLMASLPRLD